MWYADIPLKYNPCKLNSLFIFTIISPIDSAIIRAKPCSITYWRHLHG